MQVFLTGYYNRLFFPLFPTNLSAMNTFLPCSKCDDEMEISTFQQLMQRLYLVHASHRGIHRTELWLGEEMGELMRELKK